MSNCFKGDFKVTTQSLMGKAELKKLHSMLIGEFPLLSKKMIEKVLSSKEDINILKCSNGTALYVSGEGNPPAFFDDGFGGVYPTLFTLWRLGNFMPTLVTHPQVSKFVLPKESQRSAGADMMLPGVIVPDEGLGPLHEGQKRAICVEGNDAVVGVGKMVVSDSDIKQKGMKGKGMEVRHVYLDSLWKYGGRKVPNDGFHADEVVAAEGNSIMAPAAADEEEAEEEEEEEAEEAGGGDAAVEEMEPDVLMAYCFYAAFKTTYRFGAADHGRQVLLGTHAGSAQFGAQFGPGAIRAILSRRPSSVCRARGRRAPAARRERRSGSRWALAQFGATAQFGAQFGAMSILTPRNCSSQVGKYIKTMHKSKACVTKENKNIVSIVSVDRAAAAYLAFELKGTRSARSSNTAEVAEGGGPPPAVGGAKKGGEEETVRCGAARRRSPKCGNLNSYTKPLFEAVGRKDKSEYFSKADAHAVLATYIANHLSAGATGGGGGGGGGGGAADSWEDDLDDEAAAGGVAGFLTGAGVPAAAAGGYAVPSPPMASTRCRRCSRARSVHELMATHKRVPTTLRSSCAPSAAGKLAASLRGWLEATATSPPPPPPPRPPPSLPTASTHPKRSPPALSPSLSSGTYGLAPEPADAVFSAVASGAAAQPPAAAGASGGGAGGGAGGLGGVDPSAVPLDEMLINSLVKMAGGQKAGTTFPSHLPLSDLQERILDRMTQFSKVSLENEAPVMKKGAVKPIKIQMKRAAGHNKTHIEGLESFGIAPEAVADALKKKLGCTTAVLKLPGNNVKDHEVLLQGHCVTEVTEYLRDCYCLGKEWLDMGQVDRELKKKQQSGEASRPNFR